VRLKDKGKSQAVVTKQKRDDTGGQHRLYHLPDDPAELKDVGTAQPEKLKAMIAKMDELIAAGRSRK
jgi:hypothetical protein